MRTCLNADCLSGYLMQGMITDLNVVQYACSPGHGGHHAGIWHCILTGETARSGAASTQCPVWHMALQIPCMDPATWKGVT